MKITVDTNILVRTVVRDDEKQAEAAANALNGLCLIALPLSLTMLFFVCNDPHENAACHEWNAGREGNQPGICWVRGTQSLRDRTTPLAACRKVAV
jgi:hypothetical protein